MKKVLIFLVVLSLFTTFGTNAQSYQINKYNYDYRMYVPEYGDPYNPALSGVASFFIPGLGQMISGEVGRGFAFLGGATLCGVVSTVGLTRFVLANAEYQNNSYGNQNVRTDGIGMFLLGLGGMLVVDIWSIVDAVKVAKVNNMYIRDRRNQSMIDIGISPYIETVSLGDRQITPIGLSLNVRF